ncbi:carbonyl reductase family member 4-like isoform X2 [Anneissia japonica]|uniref:carbonyl reductase family member 4-like isoform X2 n=1 Tax=Anneissia japonica TaxID=1529436 RepID=UPI0014259C37|nr:carbonyl reductase family member 4-like isoform X2 [Anneissia japonica]
MRNAGVGIVFGGSGGIGRAIALNLLKNKYNVAILGRDGSKLHSAKDEMERQATENGLNHCRLLALTCDVTQASSVKTRLEEIEDRFDGGIDVLVNAAGIARDALLLRTSAETIEELLQTNLMASIVTSQAVLRGMVKRKKGSILNIGMRIRKTSLHEPIDIFV